MKLLITGSRKATSEMLAYALKAVSRAKELGWHIVVGDAPGLDASVIAACDELGVPVEVHGAHGRIRNRTKTGKNIAHECNYTMRDQIMAEACDACLAVWNGHSKGTRITFRCAENLGKTVWVRNFGKTKGGDSRRSLETESLKDIAQNKIKAFSGAFEFLNNFHPSRIEWEGVEYTSVEHAFQATKTLDPLQKASIKECPTPGEARRAGRALKLRPDWESIRVDVMCRLLREKFSDPILKQKLLATGQAELIEGNWWGDRFWGVCDGKGRNMLGKLLMQIREELRE